MALHFPRLYPLETAPKNGQLVDLFWCPNKKIEHEAKGFWANNGWRDPDDHPESEFVGMTHWSPRKGPKKVIQL